MITRKELLLLLAGVEIVGSAVRRAVAASPSQIALPGVNLAGAEFADQDTRPIGQSHIYPPNEAFAYYAQKGFKLVRLPFRIERVQPNVGGPFSNVAIAEIDRCVVTAKANGLVLVLDAHTYGQRVRTKITAEDLSRFWAAIASRYKGHSHVAYGLMNEPYVFAPADWRNVVNAVVEAIRATGSTQLLMVPGGDWTGAHAWVAVGNAAAFEGFSDPNFRFEVHQYLDHGSSGQNVREYTLGAGKERLKVFTEWARARGYKAFLGEFGFAMPAGEAETRSMLDYMTENSDVWQAWAIWAGGPWWGHFEFSIEPDGAQDKPQMAVLREYLTR
jgi:endoglucanase